MGGLNIKKIVVIGPESTGKSTLSKMLADALQTAWVPEYARDYLLNLNKPYSETDLLEIARGQLKLEDFKLGVARNFLICDTDLYVHKVWCEHSFHFCHRWILEQIAIRKYDLYLLADIDLPWEYDPLREHGEPHWRDYFYQQYKDIVINSGVPWQRISGNKEERLKAALKCIDTHMPA